MGAGFAENSLCAKNRKMPKVVQHLSKKQKFNGGVGQISDWGQSVFQFRGDDKTGDCISMVTAIFVYYFSINNN